MLLFLWRNLDPSHWPQHRQAELPFKDPLLQKHLSLDDAVEFQQKPWSTNSLQGCLGETENFWYWLRNVLSLQDTQISVNSYSVFPKIQLSIHGEADEAATSATTCSPIYFHLGVSCSRSYWTFTNTTGLRAHHFGSFYPWSEAGGLNSPLSHPDLLNITSPWAWVLWIFNNSAQENPSYFRGLSIGSGVRMVFNGMGWVWNTEERTQGDGRGKGADIYF